MISATCPVGARAAVGRERRDPPRFSQSQDRGANLVGQLIADRVAQPVLATEVHDLVRRPGAVCSYHDLDRLDQLGRDFCERVLDHGDVIGGGVGARVCRAAGSRPTQRGYHVTQAGPGLVGAGEAVVDGDRGCGRLVRSLCPVSRSSSFGRTRRRRSLHHRSGPTP